MGAAVVWVPPLGSLLFLVLAWMVQIADLRQQRADAIEERRVLPRAWSQASANAKHDAHWYMCLAAIVLSTTLSATVLWQYEANNGADTSLLIFGEVAAASLYLMAIVPTSSNTVFATVYHAVTAGIFLATSANYTFRSAFLANELGSEIIFFIRLICTGLVFLALAYMLFGGLYLYYTAASKLQKGRISGTDYVSVLTAEKELSLRKRLTWLAVAQGVAGIGIALALATAAADTLKISDQQSILGVVVGVSVLFITSLATGVAYKLR